MGLSEHEKRVLDELERSLYADDEQLARRFKEAAGQTPEAKRQRNAARRVAGVFIGVAGLGVILVSVIIHYVFMGLAGFVVMLGGLLLATSNAASLDAPKTSSAGRSPKAKPLGSLRDFFEERWDKRNGGF